MFTLLIKPDVLDLLAVGENNGRYVIHRALSPYRSVEQ
jgi:hypothetical protein